MKDSVNIHTVITKKLLVPFLISVISFFGVTSYTVFAQSANKPLHSPLDYYQGHPPFHVNRLPSQTNNTVSGLTPVQIRAVYNLPSGGTGTIAIIDAYDDPSVLNDLKTFSSNFNLPILQTCTGATQSQCFEKHTMARRVQANSGWALEESLDTQWAHAIAPNAHILLVEAKSASGTDLLNAVNYARNRSDVVAISMSWGSNEFSGENAYDTSFISPYHASFFASSGDSGAGVQWPAVSSNVIGVGGTTLHLLNGQFSSETAWSGSGGGLSNYESEPSYQVAYGVPQANGFRAVPDVSFDADPASGVAVYDSTSYQGQSGWFQVGGTSLGAPSWAAIRSLSTSATAAKFYQDAAGVSYGTYFRDIISGSNGSCGFYCNAVVNYDYVTGLGSPITTSF
ncbi:MAG TPA: S53 family peptidase [Candidatus Acidoferrales bacterium]|nr:S53 family peptidase [Candidatus Acidoferrales bacterium]